MQIFGNITYLHDNNTILPRDDKYHCTRDHPADDISDFKIDNFIINNSSVGIQVIQIDVDSLGVATIRKKIHDLIDFIFVVLYEIINKINNMNLNANFLMLEKTISQANSEQAYEVLKNSINTLIMQIRDSNS